MLALSRGRRLNDRSASPVPLDVVIAAAALAGSLAQLSHGGFGFEDPGPGGLDGASVFLTLWATAPLVAWRRAPCAVFVLTASASVLLGSLGDPVGLPLGATMALYLWAASRDERGPWTRRDTGIVLALFLAFILATGFGDQRFPGPEFLHTALAWAVAWFAGERTRLRREHMTELEQRALRAEHEAERERRVAVAEERARIARDLHDAAGHAINVIAVRAGAARMRRQSERSQLALEEIERLARKTAGEIDQIVGTLRERDSDDHAVDAPPGLASLSTLVAHHNATGLEVSVVSDGNPRTLDSVVDQTAFRILQEALTNAARYGNGVADVELTFGSTALDVTVSNGVSDVTLPRENGGHGLIGMRERAALLGGRVDAERINGSFRLRARLPYEGPSA
jgi:signal transduction histidine kinase